MPDNVPITPGSGVNIASDDIAGVQHQRVKVEFGADGSASDVSASNPLPVVANQRALEVSGSGSGANTVIFTQQVDGYNFVAMQVTQAGFDGSFQIQVSNDNTNWVGIQAFTPAFTSPATTISSPALGGLYWATLGFKYCRVRIIGGGTGNPTLAMTAVFSVVPTQWVTLQAQVVGTIGHGAADSGSPVKIGGRASAAPLSAVSNNQRSDAMMTLDGGQVVASAQRTDRLYDAGVAIAPSFAPINASGVNDNQIVAADASKKIRVLAAILSFSGNVTARFRRDTTDISGNIHGAQNTTVVLPFNPIGWFETAANQPLNLFLGSATAVTGSVVYILV